jgi:hypothetical protein
LIASILNSSAYRFALITPPFLAKSQGSEVSITPSAIHSDLVHLFFANFGLN